MTIHSVIQAPDGRRMSKSLGTGIDPLDLIDEHGADALRFGLLAMSSAQDVRFNEERVKQGRDLANKLWNASRLILLRVSERRARRRAPARRSRTAGSCRASSASPARVDELFDGFRFSHAALELYGAFWSRAVRLVPRARQAAPLRGGQRGRRRPCCSRRSSARCGCCTR